MKKILSLVVLAVSILFTVSCNKTEEEEIKISFAKSEVTINVGEKTKLVPTITPNKSYSNMVWESMNTKVATVDKNTGEVTGVIGGESIIILSIGDKQGKCKVIVKDIPVTKITLNETKTELEEKKTLQLTATIEPENATNATIEWSSDNRNAADVDQKGLVTAVKAGKAIIKAKCGDIETSCEVTVIPEKLKITTEVSNIKPANATIKVVVSNAERKYRIDCMAKVDYDRWGNNSTGTEGGIAFDKSWYGMLAGEDGTWQSVVKEEKMVSGNLEKKLNEFIKVATPNTEYVVYSYTFDVEDNPVDYTIKTFTTAVPITSTNQITVKQTDVHTNGISANFTVTNETETYFIDIQSKSFVDFYKEDPNSTVDFDMAYNLIRANADYNGGNIILQKGNLALSPGNPLYANRSGADYVLIWFSYDRENGVTSKVGMLDFTTK